MSRAIAVVLTGILSALMLGTPPAHAAISGQSATNDAINVYYRYQYTGSPAFRRAYVDTDRNRAPVSPPLESAPITCWRTARCTGIKAGVRVGLS